MADTKTQTSVADELRAAAALLRERVDTFRREAAVSPYWQGFAEYGHGVDNAMGGAGGRLAMLFTPEVAEALAAWLESWDGVDLDEGGPLPEDFEHALRVARALNGAAS